MSLLPGCATITLALFQVFQFTCVHTSPGGQFSRLGSHYEETMEPERWAAAERACHRRFGRLASVTSAADNVALARLLSPRGTPGPRPSLWIGARVSWAASGDIGASGRPGRPPSQASSVGGLEAPSVPMLEFPERTDKKFARLHVPVPDLDAVTACLRVQCLDPQPGILTLFSYAAPDFTNAFQLRANVPSAAGEALQVALIVHGKHGPYRPLRSLADGRWRHVCVAWGGRDGSWAIYVDGAKRESGRGLNTGSKIAGGGVFIIAQEQDSLGGAFKRDEAFSGNLTDLRLWRRELGEDEVAALASSCAPPHAAGAASDASLLFSWDLCQLEVESSVRISQHVLQCNDSTPGVAIGFARGGGEPGARRQAPPVAVTWADGSVSTFHNVSGGGAAGAGGACAGGCAALHPATGRWEVSSCDDRKPFLCEYRQSAYESYQALATESETPFAAKLNGLIGGSLVSDYLALNSTKLLANASEAGVLMGAALQAMEGDRVALAPADLLAVARLLGSVADMGLVEGRPHIGAPGDLAGRFVALASGCLSPNNSGQWQRIEQVVGSGGPMAVVESLDKFAFQLADSLSSEKLNITLSEENIDLRIEHLELEGVRVSGVVFNPSDEAESQSSNQIEIPAAEVERLLSAGHEALTFIHAHYSSLPALLGSDAALLQYSRGPVFLTKDGRARREQRVLGTAVVSSSTRLPRVLGGAPTEISTSVQYTLHHVTQAVSLKPAKPMCVFWDFKPQMGSGGGWSDKGCKLIRTGTESTSCFCNHTTNFAVLLQVVEVERTDAEEDILNVLTFVGSGASLCALVVTLTLFVVLDIPKSDRTSIHKNLFLALTAAQIVLLCSGSTTTNRVACTAVTALLHLFFMAAFMWMLVEGLLLWSKVVTVNLSEESRMKHYYLIGWGIPVLIVGITLAAAHEDYTAARHCWLNVHSGVIWAFVGPVLFIIAVNVLVLGRVLAITMATAKRRSIMLAVSSGPTEQAYDQIRAAIKAVIVLLPILGLTWLCGVLVHLAPALAYLFIALNSLQGLFIFLIYGVYNTEVRNTIKRMKERRKALSFSNCAASSRPSSSLTSSRPTTATGPDGDGAARLTAHSPELPPTAGSARPPAAPLPPAASPRPPPPPPARQVSTLSLGPTGTGGASAYSPPSHDTSQQGPKAQNIKGPAANSTIKDVVD
uniref:Adhesion G-protein coupled receptor D2 n=1 Tax=Petromyzon marinus TaxID=7757 RepID=A0AAJ7WYV6_PETMA|nr:adhesion G-protein coupled receptor D2 [Petromyzon marinus]